MKIHNVQQGTQAWLELRAGIPTASAFDNIITKSGKPSTSAEKYMLTLLAERLMGHPIAEHVSLWMARGSTLEKEAIAFYELQRNIDTVPVGFITDDDGRYGASPDRLVGDEGLLEVKAPKEYVHLGYLLESGTAYEAYRVQVQGQMWITGRQWCDVLSYSPEMPWALCRIERDEKFIQLLSEAVKGFSVRLEAMSEDLFNRGWLKPSQAPKRSMQDELIGALKESLVEMQGKA